MTSSVATTAAPAVLGVRDGLEVVRIHAATVEASRSSVARRVVRVAEVVELEALGHGTDEQLVENDVRSGPRPASIDADLRVALLTASPRPQPAPVEPGGSFDHRLAPTAQVPMYDEHDVGGTVAGDTSPVHRAVPVEVTPDGLAGLLATLDGTSGSHGGGYQ